MPPYDQIVLQKNYYNHKEKNMHHLRIVEQSLSNVIPAKRLTTLKHMVGSAFKAKSLTVTQLGRALPSSGTEKNNIKRADRFLSNDRIHDEYPSICHKLCSWLMSSTSSPYILVDWTKMPHKNFHVLRASLAATGRAITLYEEVHDEKYLGSPKVHKLFLLTLKKILPKHCHPIIVTDAGFSVSWFKAVLKNNWDYIGRIRGHRYYSKTPGLWQKFSDLKDIATPSPQYIGEISFTKKHLFSTYLYVVKNLPRGRHAFNQSGKTRKDSNSKSKSKAATEPLSLVTSLKYNSNRANKVVKIYHTRMQIEEGIRDLKSTKYGFGFEHMMSYKPKRILILLLIAMIAAFIAYVVGYFAEKNNLHYHFQANSIKYRRVLSLVYLGKRMISQQFQRCKDNYLDCTPNYMLGTLRLENVS